ncbi:CYTH domain-containing protein [Rhizobium sp. BK376]|jgi:CYTH domain-containing protein|uniref:CYTH domain-containing protein n=1 Tax=Rhizobium sp. BK376 TaxID=2512149 RepID=UPI001045AC7E|nr:CYTH domain-containing protein [Rhizobium sp. BK376]TCR78295.1 CYTH domain-containing protein [Rhizobium sp. BK376]
MAKEIERKFLVRDDRWRNSVSEVKHFRQAYIASMEDRSVRVRLANEEVATITIKLGRSLTRDEFEYDIAATDAKELMCAAIGLVIEKKRHLVPYKGFTWEVDVFMGAHEGLIIAEVEMKSEDDNPELPDWLGQEVTGEYRYSNQALATQYGQNDYEL